MKRNTGSVIVGILGLFALSSETFGREGFHSISTLTSRPGYRKAFAPKPTCGSVRIHATRSIYLSALHCVVKDVPHTRGVDLGNLMNYESLLYFDGLEGRTLPGGEKVLATGGCFTGFGIDVLNEEDETSVRAAIDCAKGDWVIYEMPSSEASQCMSVASAPADTGDSILNLGSPKRKVERTTGMTELDGRVFSEGVVLDLADLLRDSRYSYADAWTRLFPIFQSVHAGRSLMITDAEAIGGMSGGPIVGEGFKLVGVTSLAIVPNGLWRYDVPALEGGYHYGIHGGIRVEEIFAQLNRNEPGRAENLFRCP